MNKKHSTITLCLALAFFVFNSALATVDGPLFLSDFRYSEEEAIYFILNAPWYRKIFRYDIFSLEKGEVAHTGAVMGEFSEGDRSRIAQKYGCPNDDYLESCVEEKRIIFFEQEEKRILGFESLPRIDLARNNIGINISADYQEKGRNNDWGFTEVGFVATVSQSNVEKGKIEFYGYYRDDLSIAVNFDAFLVPTTNKVLFLVGRMGRPTEGGYLLEEVFFVDGLEINYSDPLPLRTQEKCILASFKDECGSIPPWSWGKVAHPSRGGLFAGFSFDGRIDFPFSKEAVSLDYPEQIGAETRKTEKENTGSQNVETTTFLLSIGGVLLVTVLSLLHLKKKQKIKQ